ncbi:4-(cytidine 5'-diphospho)-2-C-methyl-D-erythritol kinase [Adlercreutzia sp. ZJ141]|uniref:4-(cytidine 5'-diphospho)-2-C-methyl-D-erythritol kinase n=1 Tax=Adlercreutzia sp. ZJ141 TaxID=2709406 RepID=UPI001F149AC2|nr:4-(cytidine 5'-diphospho)-2-C-methyl-D-erythritol kinase [Adlercreutzia sp. ZJ141]
MQNSMVELQDDPRTRGELVDMVGTARTSQFDARSLQSLGYLRVIAPAKVNLFLGIGCRRADGYHDAISLMHALNLHDVLHIGRVPLSESAGWKGRACAAVVGPCDNVSVHVSTIPRGGVPELDIPAEKNLVTKAVDALARKLDYTEACALDLRIEKSIPYEGGLGGGSSDAAAALLGAARLWGVDADNPALEAAARSLGSDVAFFLYGGCGLYEGTGDVFVRSLKPMTKNVALIKPEGGVSTARAYAAFDECPQEINEELLDRVNAACEAANVPLFNNLAPASERLTPLLAEIRAWAAGFPGVTDVLLCGSGATTFAVCDSFEAACALTAAAKRKGWWARTTAFGGARAAVLPQR